MLPADPPPLVQTGTAGLDEILLGGVLRNNNILVEGEPGSGKTTLGLSYIQSGADRYDEPGLIISFELDQAKLLRDAAGFHWELDRAIAQGKVAIIDTTPSVLLEELRNDDNALAERVRSMGARRLFVDGLTPIRLYADANELPFRESIHLLIDGLTRLGVTTMVTREHENGAGIPHERYVFDTILKLYHESRGRRIRREIEVVKSRGQDFVGGRHTMRIESGVGIGVYQRAQTVTKSAVDQPTSTNRLSTGTNALDELMDGGVYEGSTSLVVGISGTGKTVAGTQFLMAGAKSGKRGLLVSLDEYPQQLMRNAASLGLDLKGAVDAGQVFILYDSPLELELDVHFARIREICEREKIEQVVCDSVAVYELSQSDRASEFLYSLATYFKDRLITAFLNYESPELLGVSQISEDLKGSHLVDNIVLLSYVEISTRLRRAISVPKVRGSKNKHVTREFVIGKGGISLLAEQADDSMKVPQLPFSSYYGLLSRSPTRRAPIIEEAISQGTELPASTPQQKA